MFPGIKHPILSMLSSTGGHMRSVHEICFARASSHVADINICNKLLTQNFLNKVIRIINFAKSSKFYRRNYDLISKFQIGLKSLLRQENAIQTSKCLDPHLRMGLVPWGRFKPSSKIFLLTVPRRYFFCGSFMLFLSCVCYAFVRVCLLMPCGHLFGKG